MRPVRKRPKNWLEVILEKYPSVEALQERIEEVIKKRGELQNKQAQCYGGDKALAEQIEDLNFELDQLWDAKRFLRVGARQPTSEERKRPVPKRSEEFS